jgi:membrane protease subunit HflK
VLTEYQRAPQVTRDRMYTDAMQQIYSNVTKVMIDSRQGSNLLYLPLDKLMQQVAAAENAPTAVVPPVPAAPAAPAAADTRGRDSNNARGRERESR